MEEAVGRLSCTVNLSTIPQKEDNATELLSLQKALEHLQCPILPTPPLVLKMLINNPFLGTHAASGAVTLGTCSYLLKPTQRAEFTRGLPCPAFPEQKPANWRECWHYPSGRSAHNHPPSSRVPGTTDTAVHPVWELTPGWSSFPVPSLTHTHTYSSLFSFSDTPHSHTGGVTGNADCLGGPS